MESPIAYSISKSGLNIMVQYLASLYGKYNICFNNIVLGGIFRNQNENFVNRYNKKTPLGRMGTEDDIKGMISFLSSNLSNYVTGQNLVLDGGITCKFYITFKSKLSSILIMKVLVIGLGSMGKRRLRCLKYIEENDGFKFELFGYDKNKDRVNESKSLFNIKNFDNYEEYFENNIDLIIISTPPEYHEFYIFDSIKRNIKFFVEAGVFNNNTSLIEDRLFENNVIGMPSSTLYFHPAIRKISEIVNSGKLGKISNIFYHSGQYLPDWHSYEDVKDYYVSNKDTGGAREIVPFELTWLIKVFGFPSYISGNYKKTIEIKGAELIDDTYNLVLDYDSFSINMTVDVVSRYATRNLTINGSLFQLTWSWDTNKILIKSNSHDPEIEIINIETMNPADGYNKNITEEMYVDEIREFLNYKTDYKNDIVNNFYLDNNTIQLLNNVEEAYNTKKYIKFVNIWNSYSY